MVAPPILNVSVTASAASVPSSSHVVYTIAYSNSGGSIAPAVKIRNLIPANSAFVAAFDGGALVTGAAEWNFTTLAPGASGSVTFVVRATGAGGTSINNNGCTIAATAVNAVTATPAVTSITAAATLSSTIVVGPSPIIPGTQINAYITYTNTSATPATNVILTAPLPAESRFLSATGGGVAGGDSVTWTFPSVSGAAQTVRYSFFIDAAPGFNSFLSAAIRSDQSPAFTSAPGRLEVRPLPAAYVPGTVLSGISYINNQTGEEHPVRAVSGNTLVPFAVPPLGNWLGSLHIPRNRHLYVAITTQSGAIFDITAGGDLKSATPLARNIGDDIVDLTSDPDGNLYAIRRLLEVDQTIKKITPEGVVTSIGPVIQGASGIIWVDGLIYFSEGFGTGSGKVWKWDPTTPATTATLHASGFPRQRDHFSGHFIRNQQGKLYVMWSTLGEAPQNLGLFDITQPLTYTSATVPVTAKAAFRGDLNQMGLGLDNSIYFAGNGGNRIYRAPFVNGTYGPTVEIIGAVAGDNEALAVVPRLDLSISATASPARVMNGDVLTWTIAYSNDSTVDVHNAFVESAVPSGTSLIAAANGGTLVNGKLRWPLGTLTGGTSRSVSFTTTTTAVEGTTVSLPSYFIDGDEVVGTYGAPVTLPVERPLAIDASATPYPVLLGENVTFTLRFENLNANAGTNVVARATIPAGSSFVSASNGGTFANGVVTFNLGAIVAGGEGEVSFAVRAQTLPSITLEDYSIFATEFGTRAGSPLVVAVVPVPLDLRVSASASPEPVRSGDLLTYTLQYANDGGSTAPLTVIRSIVPQGTTFDSAAGGSLENDTVVFPLGSVTPGGSGSVTFTVAVTASAGSTITNDDISISAAEQTRSAEPVVTNVIAPLPPVPLAASLTAQPSPVIAGELLTYEIVISNPDDAPAANVVVTIAIPDHTSFVSATGGGTAEGDGTQWSLGTIEGQSTTTLAFTVRVNADHGDTIVSNGASVTSTDRDGATSNSITTSVVRPPSALRLTIDAPESVIAGSNITYTLAYANDGPSSASSAKLVDPLPGGTTFVSASNGGSLANGIVTWNLGTLAAGSSGTRTLVVTTSTPPGSTIANSGAALSAVSTLTANAPSVLTGIIGPPLMLDGTLATDQTSYLVPESVQQSATFRYLSGGSGLLTGLTATLTTINANDAAVATHAELLPALTPGQTVPVSFTWNTVGVANGAYTLRFTVDDATGATLFTRTLTFTVSALDGAGLTGTIAATNSPVHLGAGLDAHYTVANPNTIAYEPLALEIVIAHPVTLAPLVTAPVSASLGAQGSISGDVQLPTGALSTGEYPLWLTTTAGNGRLLAATTFTVLTPQIALAPNALTINAGTSGTLTVSLTASLTTDTTVTITSSDAAIAGVPQSVVIPAGASAQTFAVQGLAIGGPVTITAKLGASSVTATVRVVAAGAITATLQVYQGENVSFGVTITNGGSTALTNAPFTIDIVNPATGDIVDTIPLTVTVAAGGTYQTTLQHDTSALAPQKFDAHLVFAGIAPPQVIAQAEFEVLDPPAVRIAAAVRDSARVLIWNNCSPGNSGQPCTPVAPPFLTHTLRTAGIPYVVTGEQNDFLAKLRSGAFSAAILDEVGSSEMTIAPELLSVIHSGTGLFFIHSAPNAMPKLTPALGTTFQGKLQGPTTVQFSVTQFTAAGTLTLNGDGVRLSLDGAHPAATIAGSTTPAISYNEYGRGRVVVVPFDLEQTQTLDVAGLILAAVNWISQPAGPAYDAREVVPLRVNVTTPPGGATPIVVTVTATTGVSVVDAVPPLSSTSPVQWTATIAGNTTATFDLWVRLPDAIGTATLTISASLPGGPPIVTETVDFNVTNDATTLANALGNELTTLRAAATKNNDVQAIDEAIAQLTQLRASSDALANIGRVLKILEELDNVSLDTSAARAAADRLLVYWQSKVV
ncbi:MAG TPA: hypothetical protein VFV49_11225 [Thermoanaerobaculia bacterium]|nr:hypothetical protein [Thermoanaerobaculia bacterium]